MQKGALSISLARRDLRAAHPNQDERPRKAKHPRKAKQAHDTLGKSPGRWARPFLTLGDRMANALLSMRGYRHRRVKTPDGTMHALVCKGTGRLPPLVLLPGLGTRTSDYGLVLWRLKKRFRRVVAIDLPGHGKSQLRKPINSHSFAKAIMDTKIALAPEPSFMLGHSLGALGIMTSYALAPHEVLAMTVVNPPGGPVSPLQVQQYTRKFDIHTWEDARAIANMNEPRSCWPHLFSPAALAERLRTPSIRELLHSDVLTRPVRREHLAQLPRHTMFIWAGQEHLLPQAFRGYFLRNLPATTRVWEPCDMTHGAFAKGSSKYLKPVFRFFESAHHDLTGDPRLSSRADHRHGSFTRCG